MESQSTAPNLIIPNHTSDSKTMTVYRSASDIQTHQTVWVPYTNETPVLYKGEVSVLSAAEIAGTYAECYADDVIAPTFT
jgi:hypothetical protein